MTARAPELGDECCPGGKCEVCNCKPSLCLDCGEEIYKGERCAECEALYEAQIAKEDTVS